MDHRWDELLQAEHRRRVEEGRYGGRTIESDEDVARRDQLALARLRVNKSPWEIGASHYDQRDLYTQNSRTDDAGYGRGPSNHPDVGSYAYPRAHGAAPSTPREAGAPNVYEREAYPWLNYERVERGPKGWRRSDVAIREDVCEALTIEPHLDATNIEVEVKDEGEVWLTGTVRDRHEKRLAEAVSEKVRGVHDVHNRLTIHKSDDDLAFTTPIVAAS
ncbi:MAG: hypothetical protein JWP97_5061 [Labilithrix sp.]|nr:hypothetical protein [Labilithrix sp.]